MENAYRDENFVPTLIAASNVDGVTPVRVYADPTTHRLLVDMSGGGLGTVTTVSVATANGFAGSVANATTTPAITLSTTVTGILKGNGTAISAAIANTDYQSPITLTTTGTSGAATFNGTTLNIPQYSGGASGITIGSTTITSGTTTRVLYNNAGVVGEYTLAGSGTVVAMATAPTFVTSITTPSVLATANDSGALGASGTAFSDLFLASGGVINWNAGNILLTQATDLITLSNQNAGATGPTFEIYQDSASPAVSDVVGTLLFSGRDSAANKQNYAQELVTITDPVSTSEDATITWGVVTAGAMTNEMVLSGASLAPFANDGLALGTATVSFADLFLATGGVINFANGNATLTHSTGLLTSNVPLSLGTTNALTAGSINVGHASDTTITRTAAGVIAVEGEVLNGYATTATAAGTTALTIASAQTQFFTGTTTQTVTLPTTSVVVGQTYRIVNNSTGNVTVQSSGANTIQILGAGMSATFTAIVATPTTAANWSVSLTPFTSQNIAQTATANAATVNLAHVTNSITNNSAATLTITLPTAGAIDGEMRIVRVYDFSAVAQTITWVNTQNSTVTAPTTSNGSTTLPVTAGFQYNSASSLWRCIANA